MLEIIIVIFQVATSFYWTGELARQNPRVDSTFKYIEDGYKTFNTQLMEQKFDFGLGELRNVYKKLIILYFFVSIVLGLIAEWGGNDLVNRLLQLSPVILILILLVIAFTFSALSYSALIEQDEREKETAEHHIALFIIFILPGGILTENILAMEFIHEKVSNESDLISGLVGFLTAGILVKLYLKHLSPFFVYLSIQFIKFPTYVATRIHKAYPAKPFFGVTVLLMLLLCIAQALV